MKFATATAFGSVSRLPRLRILLSTCLLAALVPDIPAEGGPGRHVHNLKHSHRRNIRISEQNRTASGAAAAPVRPAAAPAPSPPAAPASPAAPEPSIEEQIFALTNQARQANDLVALELDPELTQAAQIQASAMALLDIMDHDLPGMPQPTLASRLQFVGYPYSWAAENIASGAPDAPSVVALWLNSPPHEQNIMSPVAVATGVAVASDRQGVLYFSQVFGEPR
jgi:uncharacterized protein YkwD